MFSPRRANLADLTHAGVPHVEYLPFGYSPSAHYYEPPVTEAEWQRFDAEVLLAGGADADRIATVTPLIHAGLRVALYGGYWTHDPATRGAARGWLDVASLRKATAAARVCLGLVRRANRDGHAMRSFEIPAMKGCLLAERTIDHEELFGADGDAVLFFDDEASLIDRARWLVGHPQDRDRLAARAHDLVTTGGHTYRDRLTRMLDRATS